MTGEKKLEEFLDAINDWISCKGLIKLERNDEVEVILNMNSSDLNHLSAKECLSHAYELYAYADYVESVKAKEKIVLEWAESSIWYIISKSLDNYGSTYTKWEQKYYSAVKENPLASDILKIKKHAESRLSIIEGKSARIQKMADILNNLSRTR